MKALGVVVALLMFLPIPTGVGQTLAPAPAEILLLEEAAGDVNFYGPQGETAEPTDSLDGSDLRSLKAVETMLDISFTLQIESLSTSDPASSQVDLTTFFRHSDRNYALRAFSFFPNIGSPNNWYGGLYVIEEGRQFYSRVADLPVEITGTFLTMRVPRELIIDNEGATPFPGRVLDSFYAEARVTIIGGINFGSTVPVSSPGSGFVDRMPDTGLGTVTLPILLGIAQSGHAVLYSEEPFRSSNGEASTFVFTIQAVNKGTAAETFEFSTKGVPSGWDVRTPGLIKLGAGQVQPVAITVRTAFAHNHGTTTEFTLEMTSRADPGSVGRIQLGLRYPAIPQPAGHHNELFLHTIDLTKEPVNLALYTALGAAGFGEYGQYGFTNTLDGDGDKRDDKVPYRGSLCETSVNENNDTVGSGYCWSFPLDPGLEMGLDVDLTKTGAYAFLFGGLFPQPGMRVEGAVNYYAPGESNPFFFFFDDGLVVAKLLPSARFDLAPNTPHLFEGIIEPQPEADLVPYERGGYLVLNIVVRTSRPDNFYLGPKTEPSLMPGGHFTLPLLEYEDPVSESFDGSELVTLTTTQNGQRQTNPGKTLVFNVTVKNTDNQTHDLDLSLVGSNRDWANIVGGSRLSLASGAEKTVRVAVAIPTTAVAGERADLILEVVSKEVFEARALIRLVATADLTGDYPDEAQLAAAPEKSKGAPGPAIGLLLIAILAMALIGRRRRLI